ncbi:hypothetical protein [Flavisolibacter tropicus]|uniref:DUF3592 domain-containing protein n=1 Tax=Flavisolibacter tropicus TaxID=1492898 RepID=A0A172U105_9BACT|nr:hypothetical protein [Flavisolibacter tropicus]ANE52902.1 hypothetical protein SY85_22895 [Flavisolibacter tropicus]
MTVTRNHIKIFFAIILIACTVAYAVRFRKASELEEHGTITTGYVTSVWDAYKGWTRFKYYYFHNGKKIKGSDSYKTLSFTIKDSLVGKAVPILYVPENPQNNKLLLTEADFNGLNKEFPDSLKWIQRYEKW